MTFLTLPGDVKRLVTRSLRGDVEVKFTGLDEHAQLLYALGHQVIYAIFTVAALVGAYLIYREGYESAAYGCLGSGGFFFLLLFGSMWRNRRRKWKRRRR